eukprot:snap_masked-scaffold_4-processed-gene-9.31-mRNA-1 protein AED:0.28 eAED:0.34 QI:0/-1/0/1/-1/1/1/0/186
MQIPLKHGVAILRSRSNSAFGAINKIWYNRSNHIAENSIDKLQGKVDGLEFEENKNICKGCIKGKFNREKQKHSNSVTIRKPLELIVADSIGPFPQSIEGFVGALIFTCAHSNFSWTFNFKNRSEIPQIIIKHITKLERQFPAKILYFQSDNALDFKRNDLISFFDKIGIERRYSIPYIREQNGRA